MSFLRPKKTEDLLSKLPSAVVIVWTSYKEDRNLNTDIRLLCEWLRRRVKILEEADVRQVCEPRSENSVHATLSNNKRCDTSYSKHCWLCQGNHLIFKCGEFEKMDVETRKQEEQNKGTCFRCLQHGHMARNCKTNINYKGKKTWTNPMLLHNFDTDVKRKSQVVERSDNIRPVDDNTVAMT